MFKYILIFIVFCLSGCALQPYTLIDKDYKGDDAGSVVLGIGWEKDLSSAHYSMLIRKKGPPAPGEKPAEVIFYFGQSAGLFAKHGDYQTDTEGGVILTYSLPPGDYEIYGYRAFLGYGVNSPGFATRENFLIPFSIIPGQTTYLGNYKANKTTAKNRLGQEVMSGIILTISDRLIEQLAIAKTKSNLPLGNIIDQTPSQKQIDNTLTSSPIKN